MIIQRFRGVFWLRANIKHLFQCSKQTPAEHFKSNSEFSSFVSQRPRKRWTGYFFPFVQKLCLESESESPTKDLFLEKISWTLYCLVCFGLDFSALDETQLCWFSWQNPLLPDNMAMNPIVTILFSNLIFDAVMTNIARGTTDPGYWVHNSNHPNCSSMLIVESTLLTWSALFFWIFLQNSRST